MGPPQSKHASLGPIVPIDDEACLNTLRYCEVLQGVEGLDKEHTVKFMANHLLTVHAKAVVLEGQQDSCL